MNLENYIILGSIIGLAILVFIIVRRLLERSMTSRERSLALVRADEEATTTWPHRPRRPAPTPEFSERLDKSFEGMVQNSGMDLNTGQMLGMIALAGLSVAALLFFWREEEWAGGLGLILGVTLPILVLLFFQRRRRLLLQSQLPDAFFFLARSLRAGLTLDQGVLRAGEQLEEPLAAEFRRASSQIQLGLHPQLALENMAERLRLPDFNIFVSTVGLSYQSGGNLALLLDRLAASTRDRVQFIGYFRAATALGRTAGIVLGAAIPLIIIAYAVFQPEHARDLFRTTMGLQLLGIVAVLEIIGIAWFFYLLRIDY